jgi:hypothetical protein
MHHHLLLPLPWLRGEPPQQTSSWALLRMMSWHSPCQKMLPLPKMKIQILPSETALP